MPPRVIYEFFGGFFRPFHHRHNKDRGHFVDVGMLNQRWNGFEMLHNRLKQVELPGYSICTEFGQVKFHCPNGKRVPFIIRVHFTVSSSQPSWTKHSKFNGPFIQAIFNFLRFPKVFSAFLHENGINFIIFPLRNCKTPQKSDGHQFHYGNDARHFLAATLRPICWPFRRPRKSPLLAIPGSDQIHAHINNCVLFSYRYTNQPNTHSSIFAPFCRGICHTHKKCPSSQKTMMLRMTAKESTSRLLYCSPSLLLLLMLAVFACSMFPLTVASSALPDSRQLKDDSQPMVRQNGSLKMPVCSPHAGKTLLRMGRDVGQTVADAGTT